MYILAKQIKWEVLKILDPTLRRRDYNSRKRRGRPVSSSTSSIRFCADHFPTRSE